MNVVFLDVARTRRATGDAERLEASGNRRSLRVSIAPNATMAVQQSFAYGETDQRDPQFYVLDSSDTQPCTACVSCLVRDSRRWYVIEDGQGNIQVEGDCLRTLVERLCGYWSLMRHTLAAAVALFGQWVGDGPVAENLIGVINCFSPIG